MWLVEVGCRAAVAYDSSRSGDGYRFSTYLYDVMEKRVPDFYRRKGEGFGDKRYGSDNRVVLSDDVTHVDNVDFDGLVDERRRTRWQQAAEVTEWTLEEWVVITLDKAAGSVLDSTPPSPTRSTPPPEYLRSSLSNRAGEKNSR